MSSHRLRLATKISPATPIGPKGCGETALSSLSSSPRNVVPFTRCRLLKSNAVWPQRCSRFGWYRPVTNVSPVAPMGLAVEVEEGHRGLEPRPRAPLFHRDRRATTRSTPTPIGPRASGPTAPSSLLLLTHNEKALLPSSRLESGAVGPERRQRYLCYRPLTLSKPGECGPNLLHIFPDLTFLLGIAQEIGRMERSNETDTLDFMKAAAQFRYGNLHAKHRLG